MVKSEKGNAKKDWFFGIMVTQSVVCAVLIALLLFSFKSDGKFADIMTEGYMKFMSGDFTKEDFSDAFRFVNEYADVFSQKETENTTSANTDNTNQTVTEKESEMLTELSAGGKDLEFSSLDTLEGLCFENIETGVEMKLPLNDYSITSGFGYRIGPISGEPGIHTGLDMAAAYGATIRAAADGIVVDSSWDDSYGNYIKILHENNTVTIYAHCSYLCVDEGENVEQGEKIAEVGSTGASTGNHLHFEIRKDNIRINPEYALFGL